MHYEYLGNGGVHYLYDILFYMFSQDAGSPWILSNGCMEKVAVIVENHIVLFEDCCANHICSFTASKYGFNIIPIIKVIKH